MDYHYVLWSNSRISMHLISLCFVLYFLIKFLF